MNLHVFCFEDIAYNDNVWVSRVKAESDLTYKKKSTNILQIVTMC